jgi:hypothetical protein
MIFKVRTLRLGRYWCAAFKLQTSILRLPIVAKHSLVELHAV